MLEVNDNIFDSLFDPADTESSREKPSKDDSPKDNSSREDSPSAPALNKNGDFRGGPGQAKPTSGRNEGDTAIPDIVQEMIARTAIVDKGANVAEAFGVAPSTVNNYKNHTIQTDTFVEKAQEQASKLLLDALGVITAQEISCAPLKEKVIVADRLAGVVNKLGNRNGQATIQQIILYKPEPKSVSDFEVIDV